MGVHYTGQLFFRRGRNTTASGTNSALETAAVGAGGDCAARNVTGWVLTNTSGSAVVGGDSGGPLLLAYNGRWYIAGITSTVGPTGSGGRSARLSIPSGWTVCTSQSNC